MVSVPSAYVNNSGYRIAICMPVMDNCSTLFTRSLSNLLHKCGRDKKPVTTHMVYGSNVISQRYELAKEALDTSADFLLWLDSDITFPSDLIDRLLNRKAKLVGVPYTTRIRPIRSTAFKSSLDYNARLNSATDKGLALEKVSALGFGCVLIHREVFEKTEQPWFGTRYDEKTKTIMGEDIYFFEKAAEAGFQAYADFEIADSVTHVGSKAFSLQDIEE